MTLEELQEENKKLKDELEKSKKKIEELTRDVTDKQTQISKLLVANNELISIGNNNSKEAEERKKVIEKTMSDVVNHKVN